MSPSVPVGQEATLRGLAAAMARGAVLAGAITVVAGVVVAAVVAGPSGAWSALLGGTIALGSSLITVALMRRTAALAPQAVMVVSFGSLLLKAIVLLPALFLLDRVDGVHRESLALSVLAVLIVVSAAQGWAGYRTPTMIVDPLAAAAEPATSGSMTGMSGSVTSASPEVDGRAGSVPRRPDHEE